MMKSNNMKKIYALMAATLMATATLAQTSFDRTQAAERPTLPRLAAKQTAQQSLHDLMLQNGKALQAPAKASEQADIIYDQPEGTLCHNWYGYKQGYYNFWYSAFEGENDADADDFVVADDGTVYLKNPVSFYPACTSWIKGTKAEGDTIAFEFPQRVFEETVSGTHYYYSIYRMVKNGSDWAVDESTQTVKFVFRNDSLFKAETESLMGLCSEDGSTWTSYGDYNVVVTKISESTVAPQNPAAAKEYKMAYTVDGESMEKVVKLAIEDGNAYLGAFASNQPDAWAKGRVEDGKIVFEGRTYLGVDESERCHTWFVPATITTVTLPNGYSYEDYVEAESLTFTYDAEKDSIYSDGAFIVNIGKNAISAWEAFSTPTLTPYEEHAGQPEKPVFDDYMAFTEENGYGGIRFTLSNYSTDGYYLNPSKLFYRIYFDMKEYTFTPEEYVYLTEPMTDIPYSFSDDYDFRVDGDLHTVYYYRNDFETIGVAAFYQGSDMVYPSTLVYLNVKNIGDGIDAVDADHGQILSTTYTDLCGRTVSQPAHGLYIKTTKYADGTVRSTKTAIR